MLLCSILLRVSARKNSDKIVLNGKKAPNLRHRLMANYFISFNALVFSDFCLCYYLSLSNLVIHSVQAQKGVCVGGGV